MCTRRMWISPPHPSAEPNVLDKLLRDLFCTSVDARERVRRTLQARIRAWPEGDILDLPHVIESFAAAVTRRLDVDPCLSRLDTANAVLSGEDAIRRLVRAPIESALRKKDRMSPIAASGATIAYLRRSPSKAVSGYLISLVT